MSGFIRKIPFLSGYFTTSPLYHTGSVWENRLGLQLLRLLNRNLFYALRSRPKVSKENLDNASVLENDGVLQISNFLSAENWAKVKAEYDACIPGLNFKQYKKGDEFSMMAARVQLLEDSDNFPNTIKLLGDNATLKELASYALRKDLSKYKPQLTYLVLKKDDNEILDDDIENILHADVHYPTIKCFLYLGEATKENGAFIYAKGSHKLSMARLRFEYNMSIRQARIKKGDMNYDKKYLEKRGNIYRNIVSQEQRREMGINETQFVGPANTLIITNNLGFHRRGEFEKNQERATLLINFRTAEAGWLRRFLNKDSLRKMKLD